MIPVPKPAPTEKPRKPMKRTGWLKRGSAQLVRSPMRRKKRDAAETARIHGPPGFAAFVSSLPCAGCGRVGASQNAHVTDDGEKGMGRKAGWRCVTPLCGPHPGTISYAGCHRAFDERQFPFDTERVRNRVIASAKATYRAWLRYSGANE